jgi:hypothetical protein
LPLSSWTKAVDAATRTNGHRVPRPLDLLEDVCHSRKVLPHFDLLCGTPQQKVADCPDANAN